MKRFFIGALLLLAAASAHAQPADVTFNGLRLGTGTKTATAASGAATLNNIAGIITTESLSTAAAASYTLTLTNSRVAATDQVYASVAYGTASTGEPHIMRVQPAAGSVTIVVRNSASAAAFNGTLKVSFFILKN